MQKDRVKNEQAKKDHPIIKQLVNAQVDKNAIASKAVALHVLKLV